MSRLTMAEQYKSIAERSGLSENVVKQVLKAFGEQAASELASGNNFIIPCIGTLTADIHEVLNFTGGIHEQNMAKVKVKISPTLVDRINENLKTAVSGDLQDDEDYSNIKVRQISSLQ